MSDLRARCHTKVSMISEERCEVILRQKNADYRSGKPTISDSVYDAMMSVAAEIHPSNPWFNQKEVEPDVVGGKTVKLPERMLSTNKAYSEKEIEKWVCDVEAVGRELGIKDVFFRATPKLDGFAAYDDGKKLYTRGDGRSGTDITRAIDRGLEFGVRGLGAGEIVVNKSYFREHLSCCFENSRNIIAGVIKEGELSPLIADAVLAGAVRFQPFSNVMGWTRCADDLVCQLEDMWQSNIARCDFDTDGLVIEVTSAKIKERMGSTNHHHRWQIAYKKNEEFHNITVTGLVWQTSKNGRLTPVVQLEPTKVSGVTISKATGHHYSNVKNGGIDTGAIVKVCRSGLVIPYIEQVVKRSPLVFNTPSVCPSCASMTVVDGDNLMCSNTETCPAQIEGRIEFFFKTLGNCDGFGPKVIEQLVKYGENSVRSIYTMTPLCFTRAEFFGKTSTNLFDELVASRQRPIEDWRFLAAFSIHNVGKGGCERLLKHHRLADVFTLTRDNIVAIDGFAQKSANNLIYSLKKIKPAFDCLMSLGFNLVETPIGSESSVVSLISGKTVVFTGSMQKGKRGDMEKTAKSLGAKVGSSVSSKTDYLVVGENVGAAKTSAAERFGVRVLTEGDYLKMIVQP